MTSFTPDPAAIRLAVRGRIGTISDEQRRRLLEREAIGARAEEAAVREIINDVRLRGDAALRELARRLDGVELDDLEVPRAAWDRAIDTLPAEVRGALERAARNIETFHRAQLPADVTVEVEPGVRVSRRWSPLASVGVYAPGGTAAYPSSVLMGVVPARAAGVPDVVVCSPPGPTGAPAVEVLAACALGGASRLFALGGAGAVAAMAYGTESVPAVQAIVGPGNRWVTEAKRQIAGEVPIDAPAGPSEVLVLADGTADPTLVAAELLAQAEHDVDAAVVLVTTEQSLADEVARLLAASLPRQPRGDIIGEALARGGAVLVAESLGEALQFAEAYAPEHLAVITEDAAADASRVSTAGSVFVGDASSVAFGDYLTGANHVLPTGGRARSLSGLSTVHYLRSFTVQELTREGARNMASATAVLARAEGLPAHAAAADLRRDA